MESWLLNHEAATSVLAYGELVEYLMGRPDDAALRRSLHDMLGEVYPHLPTFPIMDRYAHLRRLMRPPRGSGLIGDIDTLIAATALEHDLTVVTTDGDFTGVPGLSVLLLTPRTYAAVEPTEL
jgi:predicted nucleic acid-binding protein